MKLGDRVVFCPGTRVHPPQDSGTVAGLGDDGKLWVCWDGGDLTWEQPADLRLDENPWPVPETHWEAR